jgi:accessory colonization factor AcfC
MRPACNSRSARNRFGNKCRGSRVAALRRNIVSYACNSAIARQTSIAQPDIDVWLILNIWQVANPSLADAVPIEPRYASYRDAGVAVPKRGS